jgi:hypothetical protein
MLNKEKIIFLDFDGVLNSQLFFENESQSDRYKRSEKDAPHGCWDLDKRAIRLLNDIISSSGADVVVSSTWRYNRTLGDLQSVLDYVGFGGKVIGATPMLEFNQDDYVMSVPRGCEIDMWIRAYTAKKRRTNSARHLKYVIIDDDPDMLYKQRNNFVKTDPYVGLTPTTAREALKVLEL